jgi:hypothetical protein
MHNHEARYKVHEDLRRVVEQKSDGILRVLYKELQKLRLDESTVN